ncbi:MAG: dihydrolipoyl dehydrogenase [Tissierellia bacterium]|nr:dihydrolipoyl dehydrogenase [Tissierellia bacterium]
MTKRIAIIGAGPGGYVAAIRGAQLGGEIFLIEKNEVGGTCLNSGCIPTKTYFQNAKIMNYAKHSEEFGISMENVSISGEKLLERKNGIVKNLVGGIEQLLKSYPNIELLRGTGKIIDKNNLVVELKDGEKREIEVDNIVIATGSKPLMPDVLGMDLDEVIDSDALLEMDVIPEKLIVVGGGVVGLEFASIYQALGSQVVLLSSRILKDADKEISKRMIPLLKKQGIELYNDIRATKIVKEDGVLKVTAAYKNKDEEIEVTGDYVLIAGGRGPVFQALGLDEIGIEYSNRGISVRENFETSISGIYAIGDVNGGVQLAHVASAQGEFVMEHLLGDAGNKDFENYPNCVFTLDEVAYVGRTEEELKEAGVEYKVSKANFASNGKSLAVGNINGFVKVLGDEDGKVLGVHIIGPEANLLIAEATLAIANNLKVEDILKTIHAHPTLAETFTEAVAGIYDQAIHVAPSRRRKK